MPVCAASGQVTSFEEDTGTVIGRAEVARIAEAVASSFSCPGACPCQPSYFSSSLTPSSAGGAVGDTCQFLANETRRDCNGILYGPYNRTSDSTWTSNNTNVATVSMGLSTCLSPGSAGITAQFQAVIYGGLGGPCDQHIVNPTNGGSMTVLDVKFRKSDQSALPSPFKVGISAMTIGNTDVGPLMHDRKQTILVVVTPAG